MKMFDDNRTVVADKEKGNIVIYKDFGRSRSDLIFIIPESICSKGIIPSTKIDENVVMEIDIPIDTIGRVYYGFFFTSKNGNKCFRIAPKEESRYVLVDSSCEGREFANALYSKHTNKEKNNSHYFVLKIR
jgi:hypothetical protein